MLESEIIKSLTVLATAFPNSGVTSKTFQVYAGMLKDLDADVFAAALEQAANGSKFFPSIAEIRDRADAITTPTQLTEADAWGQVMAAIRKVGFYGQPVFDNPIVTRAVEIMDWRTLCTSENVIADRAHFMKIYGQLAHRELEDAKLLPAARRLRELHNGNGQRQLNG